MFDDKEFIIVGAGLFGAVCAWLLHMADRPAAVIEQRGHIGGNCHDQIDSFTNIRYHTYGPHIFHCDDNEVLDFIGNFCQFNNYRHQVISCHNDSHYPMPVNLATINKFYGREFSPPEARNFMAREMAKLHFAQPANLEEQCINLVGKDLYEAFFKNYTFKQWGRKAQDLPPSIISRIPVNFNYNCSYYAKKFNAIPLGGYMPVFQKMFSGSEIILNTNYREISAQITKEKKIIYTGCLDELFNYKYGPLEYRGLTFTKEIVPAEEWQGNAVINHADLDPPWTRTCEPAYFHPEEKEWHKRNCSLIIRETPCSGEKLPYYPVNIPANNDLHKKYKREAEKFPNLYFGGRLAEYRYFDMEDTIKSAMKLVNSIINGRDI